MDASDALQLARTRFGLNTGVHVLFPRISTGSAWLPAYFGARGPVRASKEARG